MEPEIIEKLQHRRGYQGCRIRPHPFNSTVWLAEVYAPDVRSLRKGWKPFVDEKTRDYKVFKTPELAYKELEDWQRLLKESQ